MALSSASEPNWDDMLFLAKLIPRILHNVNRVCYVFGDPIQYQITDITHTTLNNYVIKQLRQADAVANDVSIFWISFKSFTQRILHFKKFYFEKSHFKLWIKTCLPHYPKISITT